MRIAVCITTYRRPEGLVRLLESVAAMDLPEDAAGPIRVVVVDNDADGSGEAAAAGFESPEWMRLEYQIEASRGISQARNAALRAALGEDLHACDAVVFVDDDELVEGQWLTELVRVRREFGADVVAGPVLPRFEREAPEWGVRGGFFGRVRHETGTQLKRAATGNVLIDAAVLREADAWFDERLGLVGGEDELFFRGLAASGKKIVWADEAVAHEYVGPDRVSVEWVLRRARRLGATSAYVDRVLSEQGASIARAHLLIGAYRMCKGLLVYLLGMVTLRKHVRVAGLRHISYGMGHIDGALGKLPEVYR